jgi:hypothetical protein
MQEGRLGMEEGRRDGGKKCMEEGVCKKVGWGCREVGETLVRSVWRKEYARRQDGGREERRGEEMHEGRRYATTPISLPISIYFPISSLVSYLLLPSQNRIPPHFQLSSYIHGFLSFSIDPYPISFPFPYPFLFFKCTKAT